MASEKTIRTALIFCLITSLLIYHGIQTVIPEQTKSSWLELIRVAQITIASFLFIILLEWPTIARLFLRDKYIAGKYLGTAHHLSPEPGDESFFRVECTIQQSLFRTTLHGSSFSNNDLVSAWKGILYQTDGKEFSFAIDLRWKDPEFGILKITFDDESARGIYYSADPGYPYAFAIDVKRLTKKQ